MKKPKLWGTTETLVSNPFCEIHRIEVKARGHSSWHHHERKWNVFSVIEGRLTIEVEYKRPGKRPLVEWLDLFPGDTMAVPPGAVHRFVNPTSEEVRALEVYYPDGLSEDIVRKDIGGIL